MEDLLYEMHTVRGPVRDGTGSAWNVVNLTARCLAFLLFLFVVRFGFLLLFLFFLLLRAKYPPEAASLGSLRSPRSACQDMGVYAGVRVCVCMCAYVCVCAGVCAGVCESASVCESAPKGLSGGPFGLPLASPGSPWTSLGIIWAPRAPF